MIEGKLNNATETPSEDWQRKHCLGFSKKNKEGKYEWDEETFKSQLKYTHAGEFTCGKCNKTTYIVKLTKDNIVGADPICCVLCNEPNIVSTDGSKITKWVEPKSYYTKKYKSTYDKILDEAKEQGRYHVLSEETNIKIMKELSSDSNTGLNSITEGNIFPTEDDVYLK